jgi:hypothetical protein
MPDPSPNVSVMAPLTPAIERVKKLLFQPFDFQVWLTIGLAAWLAQLGRSGGGGGTGFQAGDHRGGGPSLAEMLQDAWQYVLDNLYWIVPVAVGVALFALGIWLLFTWLSSRGEFMLLHCVGEHKSEVGVPWRIYAEHANSLFMFRIVVGLVTFVVAAPLVLLGVWILGRMVSGESRTLLTGLAFAVTLLSGIGVAVVFALITKFTRDFVVPIMFLHTISCVVAWRRLLLLLTDNLANFVLYILFSILLAVAIGALILALVLVTCCCAGCLMAIPYVGTVLILPIHIFRRAYSAEYLAQYGPEYNVFRWTV